MKEGDSWMKIIPLYCAEGLRPDGLRHQAAKLSAAEGKQAEWGNKITQKGGGCLNFIKVCADNTAQKRNLGKTHKT